LQIFGEDFDILENQFLSAQNEVLVGHKASLVRWSPQIHVLDSDDVRVSFGVVFKSHLDT
jgi:hypothetical protein